MSARSSSMGLLLRHKSTKVSIYPDMACVSEDHGNHTGGGKRDEIKGFSKESRYRLFRLLHSIRFDRISFVTLTYGKTFPTSGEVCKNHLRRYRRMVENAFCKIPAIWRLEFQKRGAPHFHILYLDPPYIPVRWLDWFWDEASDRLVSERFGNSVDIKINSEPKGSDVVGKYVGKYIAKLPDNGEGEENEKWGRMWGRWNVDEIQPETFTLSPYQAVLLGDLLFPPDKAGNWAPKSKENYTVFGGSMGRSSFGEEMKARIAEIREKTKDPRRLDVTFATSNPL